MTVEEIRGVEICHDDPDREIARKAVRMLREIAAQLAEHNDKSERIASALEGLERR
jgi:hypothetical protein